MELNTQVVLLALPGVFSFIINILKILVIYDGFTSIIDDSKSYHHACTFQSSKPYPSHVLLL